MSVCNILFTHCSGIFKTNGSDYAFMTNTLNKCGELERKQLVSDRLKVKLALRAGASFKNLLPGQRRGPHPFLMVFSLTFITFMQLFSITCISVFYLHSAVTLASCKLEIVNSHSTTKLTTITISNWNNKVDDGRHQP